MRTLVRSTVLLDYGKTTRSSTKILIFRTNQFLLIPLIRKGSRAQSANFRRLETTSVSSLFEVDATSLLCC